MPRAVLLLAALALVAPFAHANAPPIQSATVTPYDAALGEPVTFTDTSVDPDGTIASSVWTDIDGRSRAGTSITIAFSSAGNHRIGLRTTDDAGATVLGEVLVNVHAPIMRGRAVALAVDGTSFADTGAIDTSQNVQEARSEGEVRHGQLRAAALDAEVVALDALTAPRTLARADVGFVHVPLPIGFIRATGVESEVIARCSGAQTTARFTQLRLNDAPLVPPGEVAPDTRVELPGGGEVVLNAQVPLEGGVRVTAIRVVSPDGAVTEVATAEGAVTWCPWPT